MPGFEKEGPLSGSTIYGRKSLNGISQSPTRPISRSHRDLRGRIPARTFTVCISLMLVLTQVTDELPRLLCLSDGAEFVLCQYSPGLPKKCDGNVKEKRKKEKEKRSAMLSSTSLLSFYVLHDIYFAGPPCTCHLCNFS